MSFKLGDNIRNSTRTLSQAYTSRLGAIANTSYRHIAKRVPKRSHKRVIRYSILFANIVVLIGVLGFVLKSPDSSSTIRQNALVSDSSPASTSALDQLSAADIAVHVAKATNLPESTSVANLADTVNAQLAVSQSSDTVVAKPQVVATALKSRRDIKFYTTKAGDTVSGLAARFGITSDTIRWSNNLTGENLAAGRELIISPVSGVVYKVKPGDTADALAIKFNGTKEQIIAFNDAEISGLPVGEYIVIPNGVVASVRPAVFSATFGGNGYDFGYCTYYAALKRSQIGRPVPSNLGNASTWVSRAQQAGFSTGRTPQAGAVIWTPPRDWYGHVGFVESVNGDGSVNISEMNTAGWNVVSRKTLSAAEAARYSYIY